MPRRQILFVLALALLTGLGIVTPPFEVLRGLSLDVLTGLRWHVLGPPNASDTPVVVVAIDEATYRTPPFEGTPAITWTRELAQVLSNVVEGGAAVVGLDVIFPVSIEESSLPFGEESLGARLRGFDREWLRALNGAARDGKVVLGQVQHRDRPIQPSPGQRAAVGHQRNIRALNIWSDGDDVVRRLPLSFTIDGARVPSMSVELAARALRAEPAWDGNGRLTLGDYRVPSAVPDTLTLNFAGGADAIPTYSLADLRACGEKADQAFFRRAFAGKVVLVGTLLDVEDRKLTSQRFATAPAGAHAQRCAIATNTGVAPARQTIAGVYIHATAVANLLRRDAVLEWRWPATAALSVLFAGLAGLAAFALSPLRALAAWIALSLGWLAVATLVFRGGVALPTLQPLAAALSSLALAIGYRTTIVDRDKRLLRQSFALYLAPSIIDRMLASSRPPRLGGELRTLTIYFSDVVGFSTLSEHLPPDAVVALMNAYLSAMTDIIESEGGFVDKYIGDAIVAVFGAPADDPAHAAAATRAALRCQRRLAEMNAEGGPFADRPLAQRIGLNTGEVLVGNIGSHRRFNYTVMGDAVNLASRLENANKQYGTAILAAEATVTAAGPGFAWRKLDTIQVRGREQAVQIYEALAK
jgi:adenylate cyclase/guanylate cyclase